MLLPDVNIYLYASRPESPNHAFHKAWLEEHLSGVEPLGVSELVLSSFVRIASNHRVYKDPTPPEAAFEFCDAVLAAPAAIPLRPGPNNWSIFSELCKSVKARANLVPDAYLAALAIERGAILVSHDRGFSQFPGLRLAKPE